MSSRLKNLMKQLIIIYVVGTIIDKTKSKLFCDSRREIEIK